MKLSNLLISGFRSLALHKLRSLLSILGVIFGVISLVAMLSIGEGGKKEALRQIELLGANNVIIKSVPQTEAQKIKARERLSPGLNFNDRERLKATLPAVIDISALREIQAEIMGGPVEGSYQVVAVTEDYGLVKNLGIHAGRFLCRQDQANRALVCVLGWDVSRELGAAGHPGDYLKIGDSIFVIVGILQERHWTMPKTPVLSSRNYNQCVFIPLSSAPVLVADPDAITPVDEVSIQFKSPRDIQAGSAAIKNILQRLHYGVEDYQTVIPQELIRKAQQTQRIFNIVLGGIAGISLLVGGIGIMNIMLATVSERTREIGIRRAVGASQKHIVVQFLLEAVILTLTGGIIGSLLGSLVPLILAALVGWEAVVTGWAVVLSLTMALAVGIFFGLYPAYQAARLDPIQALRCE